MLYIDQSELRDSDNVNISNSVNSNTLFSVIIILISEEDNLMLMMIMLLLLLDSMDRMMMMMMMMTYMPVSRLMMMMLTDLPVSRLVEVLQLCCLSLSESTRQRVMSFFHFLSHVVNNQHVARVTGDKMSRSQV